jgi:hypothetical protein
MLSLLGLLGIIVAIALMVVALWPGPWTIDIRSERGDDDRINGIKEAIEILQREVDYLEGAEQDARIERLASTLSTLAERSAAIPSPELAPPAGS